LVLQKSAIRIIARLKHQESCRQAFKSTEILTITSLYILETLLFCFHELQLIESTHTYNTRNRNHLNTNSHRLEMFHKLPLHTGKSMFNKLPENIKQLKNFKNFKCELKRFLLSNSFYTLGEFMSPNV